MEEEKAIKEIRFAELRALEDIENKEMVIEGYAVKFNEPASHYGYTEVIDERAFEGCDMQDVALTYNHKKDVPAMARTRNKSLELLVDKIGLKMKATLANTTQNRDIYTSIKNGLLDKMSFAFKVAKGGDSFDYSTNTRRIKKIGKLFDVSVVNTPFYDGTQVYARSKEDFLKEKLELEKAKLMLKAKLSL